MSTARRGCCRMTGQTDRQTDGRTDERPHHRPHARSVDDIGKRLFIGQCYSSCCVETAGRIDLVFRTRNSVCKSYDKAIRESPKIGRIPLELVLYEALNLADFSDLFVTLAY